MTANYQAYFIDLDGTTYKGKKRIPAAARFIKRLQSAGKQVLFVTNNSTRSPQFVADNLAQNHAINVGPENIYTTALAAADYLDQIAGKRRSVYVVGESGLREALAAKGFKDDDQDPDFVVVGLDSHVTYEKLEKAVLLIRAGAKFIMEMALKRVGLTTADAVMVGDNYHTDIQAAINVGMDSLLVYTGLSRPAEVEQEEIQPTYTVATLDDWQID